MIKKVLSIMSLLILTVLFSTPQSVLSDSLPKATQEMLKKLKLEPSILDGIDKELQVPKKMIEGAKKVLAPLDLPGRRPGTY